MMGWVGNVQQMMRRAGPFLGAGLRRADFKITVQRDRVATDDFSVELLCKDERKSCLATGGRTENHNQQRVVLRQRQLQLLADAAAAGRPERNRRR